MAVSPVTTNYAATNNATATSTNGSSIEDITNNFMNLLVAQMQNQDPTNPMDNNQLTSLMAQFNTAAGVQQLNSTVGAVGGVISDMLQLNTTQWIGRTVLIEGDTNITTEDGEFAFALGSDADSVKVVLTDSAGNSYTAELKDVKAGVHQYSLDDLTGFQPAKPGFDNGESYKVTYSATNAQGSPVILSLKQAKVEGVALIQNQAILQLGVDGTAGLGNIYLVK
ncbi:flagellar hook assembly protein FlgD [Mixta intestinalis]|jgi:flagellar basal-body rod modification protein FlgD|uniref:Basal-body rod modification protein FlgD n=1 Tax=Mixta intestinalis TaxID=1615494 RepID=A0A6P1Q2I9_9GAMM|nr:flagellar hook capping FlgD N-terminal domain-containing protein [Mixta intestinalis]QHM73200.1 Basal-body rod modification protein FlgD [Mixta intestinalis]